MRAADRTTPSEHATERNYLEIGSSYLQQQEIARFTRKHTLQSFWHHAVPQISSSDNGQHHYLTLLDSLA
jgi:hypothetical protein